MVLIDSGGDIRIIAFVWFENRFPPFQFLGVIGLFTKVSLINTSRDEWCHLQVKLTRKHSTKVVQMLKILAYILKERMITGQISSSRGSKSQKHLCTHSMQSFKWILSLWSTVNFNPTAAATLANLQNLSILFFQKRINKRIDNELNG